MQHPPYHVHKRFRLIPLLRSDVTPHASHCRATHCSEELKLFISLDQKIDFLAQIDEDSMF